MKEELNKIITDRTSISVILFLALGVFIFILPLLRLPYNIIPILLISLIIFLAAINISRRLVIWGLIIILIEVATRTLDFIYLNYLATLTTNLFILFIVARVILEIMAEKTVSLFTILEAVNGYLLLGILFISLVGFVDTVVPGSYLQTDDHAMNLVYYTLVTLTTVGYGDITPQLPIAKSLSTIIAITGQFYIAVVVAVIVGKYASKQ